MKTSGPIVAISALATAIVAGLPWFDMPGVHVIGPTEVAAQEDREVPPPPFRSRRPVRPSSAFRAAATPPEPGLSRATVGSSASLDPQEDWTPEERRNIEVYEKSNRSVVNIMTRTVRPENLFYLEVAEGSGSGSVLDKDGHILTNLHVIQDAHRIEILLSDGQPHPARLLGYDRGYDTCCGAPAG